MVDANPVQFREKRIRASIFAGLGFAVSMLLSFQTLPGQSENDNAPTILKRSPFLPPDFTPPANTSNRSENPTRSNVGYEFRGVYQLGGEYRFLVSEQRKRDGNWVKLGESRDAYEVVDYNESTQTLTISLNGETKTIRLENLPESTSPLPVSGQPAIRAKPSGPQPQPSRRRVVRPNSPSSGSETNSNRRTPPPPPAWLEKLRESQRSGSGGGPSGTSPGGRPSGPPPTPPPDFVPPEPPPMLPEDLPPIPEGPPPEPPPEVLEAMQQGIPIQSPPNP